MNPLRSTILAAAGNDALRRLVAGAPVSRELVHRFVAGESTSHAVAVTGQLVADGIQVTLDYLGEDTTDAATAENTVLAYQTLVEALRAERLAGWAEISVEREEPVGWSTLVVCTLDRIELADDDEPLVHRRGRYLRSGP